MTPAKVPKAVRIASAAAAEIPGQPWSAQAAKFFGSSLFPRFDTVTVEL